MSEAVLRIMFVLLIIISFITLLLVVYVAILVRRRYLVIDCLQEKPFQWCTWPELLACTGLRPKALSTTLKLLLRRGRVESRESSMLAGRRDLARANLEKAVMEWESVDSPEESRVAEKNLQAARKKEAEFELDPLVVHEFRLPYFRQRRKRRKLKEILPKVFDGIPQPI